MPHHETILGLMCVPTFVEYKVNICLILIKMLLVEIRTLPQANEAMILHTHLKAYMSQI